MLNDLWIIEGNVLLFNSKPFNIFSFGFLKLRTPVNFIQREEKTGAEKVQGYEEVSWIGCLDCKWDNPGPE